eukprot:3978224-Pyramimonas_sp.AAC.1
MFLDVLPVHLLVALLQLLVRRLRARVNRPRRRRSGDGGVVGSSSRRGSRPLPGREPRLVLVRKERGLHGWHLQEELHEREARALVERVVVIAEPGQNWQGRPRMKKDAILWAQWRGGEEE